VRLASWNVNSIRARQERLLRWLERTKPDVVCLQELKVADADFPTAALREAGWYSAVHGQRTYNGVAILARAPLAQVEIGLGDGVDDPQARFLAADLSGVRVVSLYVPNGASVGSDKWEYKLVWLARLRAWLERKADPRRPLALCGDWNVAPDELDVAHPEAWRESVLFHDDARAALRRVMEWGLVDAFRRRHPHARAYSWWDYRQLAFARGDGLRIDHLLLSEPLAARLRDAGIDRDERKGKQPSDHAPVWVDLSD
jgi:exodeoxyribonuclease-3